MKVLIIGMYYRPEVSGNAPYMAGLAEQLVARGDEVTVLTGLPHYPEWRIAPGTPRAVVRREVMRGVTVVRAAHYVPSKQSATGRALYEGTFGLSGLVATLRLPRPNAILGVVPNLSSGVLARLTGQRLNVPYGLLFHNLMSRGARHAGVSGGTIVAGATAAAEVWITKRARAIGVVTEAFTPYLVSVGVPRHRIAHTPNWTHLAPPETTVEETRARFGWTDGQQVVLHAGNIGLMQGLEQVIDAARMAAARGDPVQFVLSGGGNQAETIRAAARGLPNVSLLGVQPDDVHASLLAAADVLLLSERATQIDMSMPSKLTSYFAAGRPIVAAIPLEGGSSREIERSRAGLIVPAGEPERLLAALARLRDDPDLAASLAAAGPAYAAANTSAAACLARAVALVDTIAA